MSLIANAFSPAMYALDSSTVDMNFLSLRGIPRMCWALVFSNLCSFLLSCTGILNVRLRSQRTIESSSTIPAFVCLTILLTGALLLVYLWFHCIMHPRDLGNGIVGVVATLLAFALSFFFMIFMTDSDDVAFPKRNPSSRRGPDNEGWSNGSSLSDTRMSIE
ncbi:hypothetical protein [Candidatus Similichlamydia epinepheli]|uniref:hypothetical protein n=1 Tax=Candidatus Similichlamydia epinepheli TaxID=1903953 RepID=UPI0013007D34|nr:hypothetical protein [Candidatus Similichlamydia epinepheli]